MIMHNSIIHNCTIYAIVLVMQFYNNYVVLWIIYNYVVYVLYNMRYNIIENIFYYTHIWKLWALSPRTTNYAIGFPASGKIRGVNIPRMQ